MPICILAVLQYLLSTMATTAFVSVDSPEKSCMFPQESLVWTSITEVAGASSAVLFYSSLNGGGWPFIFLGLLITGLIHLLYRLENFTWRNRVRRRDLLRKALFASWEKRRLTRHSSPHMNVEISCNCHQARRVNRRPRYTIPPICKLSPCGLEAFISLGPLIPPEMQLSYFMGGLARHQQNGLAPEPHITEFQPEPTLRIRVPARMSSSIPLATVFIFS